MTKNYVGNAIRVRDDTNGETSVGFSGQDLDTGYLMGWTKRNLMASIPLGVDANADGVSDGWTFSDNGVTLASKSINEDAQKLSVTSASVTSSTVQISKTLTAVPGNTIAVSVQYKTDNAYGRIVIRSTPSNTDVSIGANLVSDGVYTTYTATGDVIPGDTGYSIILGLRAKNVGDTGSVWIKEIPNVPLVTISNQSAYVTTIYDQSGNGLNAVQTTSGNQPRIVNDGVVDVDVSGKPTIKFNGSSSVLSIPNNSALDITAQPLMLNVVLISGEQDGRYVLTRNNDNSATIQYGIQYITSGKRYNLHLEGAVRQNTALDAFPTLTQKIYTGVFDNGVQQGYTNGEVSGNAGSYNGTLTSRANMQIGARSSNAGGTTWAIFYDGCISEVIIFRSTTGRQKLESNQKKYYNLA
jgi:hypothetical protein